MQIFLIDFENVGSIGLTGVDELPEEDNVIIFYSENADSISFEMHETLNRAKAYIELRKVMVGTKNALDFQLSAFLGYKIKDLENQPCDFYIVSNDRGYEALLDFWKEKNIFLVSNIRKDPPIAQTLAPLAEIYDETEIIETLKGIVPDKKDIPSILDIARSGRDSTAVNTWLTRKYRNDSTLAGEIYRTIKPMILV